jgi:hypothetical protein
LRGHAPGLGIVESVPNKDLLPLAEQIMRLRIGIGQLLAFHSAVYEKADIERIPLDKAAYKVVEDIRDYSQLGGLKKSITECNNRSTCSTRLWQISKPHSCL